MKYSVVAMLMVSLFLSTSLNAGIDIKVIIKECKAIIKRERKIKEYCCVGKK